MFSVVRKIPLRAPIRLPLTLSGARPLPISFTSTIRSYSKKENEPILNEDMLARAGVETESPNENGEPKNDGKDDKERSSRRRRRQTSKDIQREKYANYFYAATLFGGFAGIGYMSRDWDSEEEQTRLDGKDISGGYAPGAMYGRLSRRLSSLFTFFSEPVFENLLPPPPPEAYRRPLTLVLTLDDFLIHSSWDAKNGWRTAKRPGLDYFLGYLSQYYEIVIFGSEYQMYSDKTVNKLDPMRAYIQYALYREACRYKDGKLIKDLGLLNRDLGKTVAIDVNADSLSMNPRNSIILEPWDGKPDDTLIKLIPFLEYLANQPVKDVRPILDSFLNKTNITEEFAVRETQLRKKWLEENKDVLSRAHKPNAGNFLAGLMGIPQSSVNKEPKMPLDIIREHGQMQYESLQKYLKENEASFLEEERKMKEEYGKLTLNKLMTEGMPNPEEIAKAHAEKTKQEAEAAK